MKLKWGVLIVVSILLIAPFFVQVHQRPPNPSFVYFLDTLEFIEDTLDTIGMDLGGYSRGDFELEDVVEDLELTNRYLEHFETDQEKSRLTLTPHLKFAFQDFFDNPIRIWIGTDSFRIYSAGDDGISQSGGRDPDDIWTGEPEKAVRHTHRSFQDAWLRENPPNNLWEELFGRLK